MNRDITSIVAQYMPSMGPQLRATSRENMKGIDQYRDSILNELKTKYPASSYHKSLTAAIDANDLTMISKVSSIKGYIPIEWEYVMPVYITPTRGLDIIFEEYIQSHINKDYQSFALKRYHGEVGENPRIPKNCPGKQAFIIYMKITNEPLSPDVLNYLKNFRCVSRDVAHTVLFNVMVSNKAHIYALANAMIHGWDSLLDEYLNASNIVEVMAIAAQHNISPRSWQFLRYKGLKDIGKDYAEWFKYLEGLTSSKPADLDPNLWRQLLSNAILVGNIDLIKVIAAKYKNSISPKFKAWARDMAVREGHNVEMILNAMNG